MEIKSLGNTDFETLFNAFDRAFADYDLQLTKLQFKAMLRRRGFDPNLSFAAFDGMDIVAFTCNGIGNFNGIPTAYDTGTGTLQEYRGKGLATRIFEYSIPYLKEAGIGQYLLEVLQHNTKAVSVYRKLGFEVSREFYYFVQENDLIKHETKNPGFAYSLRQIDMEELSRLSGFRDFPPSWQNSSESIARAADDFISLGIVDGEVLAGYCIFEPASGDITQIAVDENYRRKGVASLLLEEMLKRNRYNSVKIINTDIRCESITRFLETKNIGITGKQFEMIKTV